MSNLGYGIYEQGYKLGYKLGFLLRQVKKKYQKGKSCYEIADELETDLSVIEQIYEVLEHAEADTSEKELVKILAKKNILHHLE